MKRFASHYLYLKAYGFLKQYIVEVNDHGYACHLSPLTEEAESVVWSPGIIALLPSSFRLEKNDEEANTNQKDKMIQSFFKTGTVEIKHELPEFYKNDIAQHKLIAVRLYPFDFVVMQPVSDTSIQILDKYTF